MKIDLTHARWFSSTHSATTTNGVEVAHLDSGQVGIRDSKNPSHPALVFTPDAWDTFTAGIVHGNFSRP
ncbi:DUF397 domain-containing protein [Nocardia sp. NPDC046473]|uniref:DUF397 domain-containing protein n=1 Tax=Nocardia sp. NPDC046473 TaxID=3155733 RepID=UPI0033F8235D